MELWFSLPIEMWFTLRTATQAGLPGEPQLVFWSFKASYPCLYTKILSPASLLNQPSPRDSDFAHTRFVECLNELLTHCHSGHSSSYDAFVVTLRSLLDGQSDSKTQAFPLPKIIQNSNYRVVWQKSWLKIFWRGIVGLHIRKKENILRFKQAGAHI